MIAVVICHYTYTSRAQSKKKNPKQRAADNVENHSSHYLKNTQQSKISSTVLFVGRAKSKKHLYSKF